MPILDVTCPNCGATLKVDGEAKVAACDKCGSSFVLQDTVTNVVNNNEIHVDNMSMDLEALNEYAKLKLAEEKEKREQQRLLKEKQDAERKQLIIARAKLDAERFVKAEAEKKKSIAKGIGIAIAVAIALGLLITLIVGIALGNPVAITIGLILLAIVIAVFVIWVKLND